jgi:hypothetical protein
MLGTSRSRPAARSRRLLLLNNFRRFLAASSIFESCVLRHRAAIVEAGQRAFSLPPPGDAPARSVGIFGGGDTWKN